MGTQAEKVDAFFAEIAAVCKKHGLSISHEDSHGGFIIEEYSEDNIRWLTAADRNQLLKEVNLTDMITKGPTND